MALEFIAGCVGGCAGVLVGHPFDTIKVRLQTQDPFNPKFKGTWDCLSKTVKSESIRGLYKGMSSPMAGVAAVNALVFGVHGNLIKLFKDQNAISSQGIAGAGAGFTQAFVVSPMELVKTRMQIQSNGPSSVATKYANPIQCVKSILKQDGVKGLFRGQAITVSREIPGFATYFTAYEYLVKAMTKEEEGPSTFAILTAGGLAGTVSWILTYPVDVIKSRLQADSTNKYKNAFHCLKMGIELEGYKFLSRGLTSTIIRAFPTNAATFMAVDTVMNFGMPSDKGKDSKHHDSAAWQDVLFRGEILITAASLPKATRHFSIMHKQQSLSIISNPLDTDRESSII